MSRNKKSPDEILAAHTFVGACKLTLRLGSNLADPFQTAAHARLAEEVGFDFVGAGEHVFRDERPGSTQIALSALATAAGATSRVRLLTSIVIAPLHHPVMLAKEAAVVDAASGGRLTLGVGVGGEFPTEFAALQEHHVTGALVNQVVGYAAAVYAAAYDDDVRRFWKRLLLSHSLLQ